MPSRHSPHSCTKNSSTGIDRKPQISSHHVSAIRTEEVCRAKPQSEGGRSICTTRAQSFDRDHVRRAASRSRGAIGRGIETIRPPRHSRPSRTERARSVTSELHHASVIIRPRLRGGRARKHSRCALGAFRSAGRVRATEARAALTPGVHNEQVALGAFRCAPERSASSTTEAPSQTDAVQLCNPAREPDRVRIMSFGTETSRCVTCP